MCSTNSTNFLEALLQVPGININKPDNELNTPLHYAAECGNYLFSVVFFIILLFVFLLDLNFVGLFSFWHIITVNSSIWIHNRINRVDLNNSHSLINRSNYKPSLNLFILRNFQPCFPRHNLHNRHN